MIVTPEQVGALRAAKHAQFVEDMAILIRDTDPAQAETLGLDGLRHAINIAVGLARADGITQRDPVRVYVQLVFMLGMRFTQDPMLPWARAILDPDQTYPNQAVRMEDIRRAALDHLRDVCGADGALIQGFVRTLRLNLSDGKLKMSAPATAEFIRVSYPARFNQIGPRFLAHLMEDSQKLCQQAQMRNQASAVTLTALRLMFGYWVMDDPLFPGLSAVLQDCASEVAPDMIFQTQVVEFLDNLTGSLT